MRKTVRDLKAGDVLSGSGYVVSHAWPSRKPGKWNVEGRYPRESQDTLSVWTAKTSVNVLDNDSQTG